MFWCVKKAWGERTVQLMGLDSWKPCRVLMWVISCQAFSQGRSHTLGLRLLVLLMSELNTIFLDSTLLSLAHSKWLLWVCFLIGQGVMSFKQLYKLRKTAPKLEFSKTLKLFPHVEMCSVFKLFPAFLHGNINHRVFIMSSVKSLRKYSLYSLVSFLILMFYLFSKTAYLQPCWSGNLYLIEFIQHKEALWDIPIYGISVSPELT